MGTERLFRCARLSVDLDRVTIERVAYLQKAAHIAHETGDIGCAETLRERAERMVEELAMSDTPTELWVG